MNQPIDLTLEEEFSLKGFAVIVQQMSREQAQELLIEQQHLMLTQKRMFQELLKHEWHLDVAPAS